MTSCTPVEAQPSNCTPCFVAESPTLSQCEQGINMVATTGKIGVGEFGTGGLPVHAPPPKTASLANVGLPRRSHAAKKAPPPMRNDEGIANFTQSHLCGGGCATYTAVTEMVRSLGGGHADSTLEGIRWVVQNWREQTGKTRNRIRLEDTAVEESVLQQSTCPPKPRASWQAGKVSWWKTCPRRRKYRKMEHVSELER